MSCLIPYNNGDVRIQRGETEEALLQGAEISSGDVIKTGSDGKVVLFLPDGSELELQVDTLVKLEELLEAASIKIRLLAGKIWLHVKSIAEALRARDGFEVATPIGHTGVRGTEFMVEVAEDGTTTLVVIEGLV